MKYVKEPTYKKYMTKEKSFIASKKNAKSRGRTHCLVRMLAMREHRNLSPPTWGEMLNVHRRNLKASQRQDNQR